MAEAVPVKAGVREIVAELRARGIPIGGRHLVARGTMPSATSARPGCFDLFDTIVTRDDVTNPKPHPEPYLMAARPAWGSPRRSASRSRTPMPACAPPMPPACRR